MYLKSIAFGTALVVLPQIALAQDAGGEAPRRAVEVTPYIEASQVVGAELSPGDDVVTYTQLAAGVEALVVGRNNAASASLRYERRIDWNDDGVDGDTISGIARVSAGIVPQALTIEAGALATRTTIDGNGAALAPATRSDDTSTQLYSAYAGPNLRGRLGEFEGTATYRFGYTRVEQPDAIAAAPTIAIADVFEESTVHAANARIGSAPGAALPVGIGIGGGFVQEDISNFDQRVRDTFVRADITVPVSRSVALVGGAGYEDVEISSRDVLVDPATGLPVVGADGRYVTDTTSPRRLAYDVDGLIWDVGVMWRPSRRTSASAFVGRRYGSRSFGATFGWEPDGRSSFSASVYDSISGFGGALNNALALLPAEFRANRDSVTGELNPCVGTTEGQGCIGAFGSVRSAVFRSRGVVASYARTAGRSSWGIGAGYDNRKFIAADDTILSVADGVTDETVWTSAYWNRQIDRRSGLSLSAYAHWFQSGFDEAGDSAAYGASAGYFRNLSAGLTGTAAISVTGITRDELLDDIVTASALLGVRYSF